MSEIETVELTPEQEKQWGDTCAMMGWNAPGFTHLWYKLLVNNDSKHFAVVTRDTPNAATDGKNVIINPDWFFKLTLPERVFVMGHEVVHNVYGDVDLLHRCNATGKVPMHDGSTLPYDNTTMQKSMDHRINALLIQSKIGRPPKSGNYDPNCDPNESVLDVYRRNYKKKKENGDEEGAGGFDNLLPPGKSTGQTPQQAARNPQQWAVQIAAAQTMEQIRAQGKMAGALARMFKDILEPEIPWTEHIRGIFNRRVGSGSYNWRRPDRRFIVRDLYLPSRSGFGAGWVTVWGDTSGSIGAAELERYMGELSGIIDEVKPKRLTVFWCDAAIHQIDEIEDAADLMRIKCRGVKGGGGTSCDPVFAWIDQNAHEAPDAMVCFTDGYVTFPKNAPTYPVIWASTTDVKYPWGEVVRIKT